MIRVTHYQRRPAPGAFSMERLYDDVRASLPPDIIASVSVSRFFSRGLFRRLYDAMRARRYQGDVNHVTGDVHFITYLLERRRTILTIHDLECFERLGGPKRWIFWCLWFWLPEKRSAAVVVVSQATKDRVLQYLRCDADKVKVIHNNVSAEFEPGLRPFNGTCPRLLQIGTKANKNLERTAEALSGVECQLVVVGQLSRAQAAILRRFGIDYENHVDISRQALLEEYKRSDMVVFASTYEGFGLPIVEANAVGRPVVSGNVLSMPEVAGDAACLVDPFDVSSIRAGILRVIEDSTYREQLVERGFENVERFRIDRVAEKYATLYREIYGCCNKKL